MFIATNVTTEFDGFNFEMTYCHDTPCIGVVLQVYSVNKSDHLERRRCMHMGIRRFFYA